MRKTFEMAQSFIEPSTDITARRVKKTTREKNNNSTFKIMKPSSALSLLVFLLLDRNILIETKAAHAASTRSPRQNSQVFLSSSLFFYGPPILTVTLSSLTTVTQMDSISIVCAKLVNVTGPCLRRRGAWVEEPIVLSFHGDFDDAFDMMYSPVLGVEATPAPETSTFDDRQKGADISTTVASSLETENEEHLRQNGLPFDFFRGVSRWFNSIITQLIVTTIAETKAKTSIFQKRPTNTVIYHQTITVTQTATVVNTVFVQRCTPSPFPFSLCRQRKSRPVLTI